MFKLLEASPLALTILTAICFGSWTFLIRFAGLGTIPSAFIVEVTAVMMIIIAHFFFPDVGWSKVTMATVSIVVLGALINGIGIFGNIYIVMHGTWPLAKYQVILVGVLQVVSVLVGVLLFRERLSLEEWVLIALIGICTVRLAHVHHTDGS